MSNCKKEDSNYDNCNFIYSIGGNFERGGNIFMDINNQSYLLEKKFIVSESIITNQAIMSKFIGKKYLFCTINTKYTKILPLEITLRKCPAI